MNSKITFPELIEMLSVSTNTSKRMSELFLKELFATISQALIYGESVRIKNLGQFKVEEVKSRKSVSVNTGQEVEIPSHKRVTFIPAKPLADAINEPFAHFETVILDDDVTDEQLEAINGDVLVTETVENEPTVEEEPVVEETEAVLPDDTDDGEAEETETAVVLPPPFVPEQLEPQDDESAEQEEVAGAAVPLFESPQEPVSVPEPPVAPVAEPEPEVAPEEEQEVVEPVPEPEAEVVPEPAPEVIPEPEEESEEEEIPQSVDEGYSIVEWERTKREVARKSMFKGIMAGALGMLLLLGIGWGVYHFVTTDSNGDDHKTAVLTADKDEQSNSELVMREDIEKGAGSYGETIAEPEPQPEVKPVEKPVEAKVVTDTCTQTMYLTRMAKKHYGHKDFWVYIYEENKNIIDNPNRITPGTIVVIPPAEKYGIDVNDPESLKKAKAKSSELFARFQSSPSGSAKKRKR